MREVYFQMLSRTEEDPIRLFREMIFFSGNQKSKIFSFEEMRADFESIVFFSKAVEILENAEKKNTRFRRRWFELC